MLKKALPIVEHYLKEELYEQVRCDPGIFDFIQSATLDALWYRDLEHPEQEWMNEGFWRLLGYAPSEKKHQSSEWQNLIHPDDHKKAQLNLIKHLQDPSHPYDQIVRFKHRDGSTVWVRCRGMVIRDHHGNPTRLLGAHTDVSALMETRNELERKTKRLSEEIKKRKAADHASKAKNTFLANMSHELRTPLTAIIGMADLMQSELYGKHSHEKYKEYSDDIAESGKHLLSVINDILDLARIESKKLILSENLFSIRDCLDCCITMVSANMATDRITMLMDENLPDMYADERLVRQAVINLLTNACKFSPNGEPVFLTAALSPKKEMQITITDNGIGIAEKDIERIMEPFVQATENAVHTHEGVGLGLPLVKKFMELHGGSVNIDSVLSKGTTITLTFPPGRTHHYS